MRRAPLACALALTALLSSLTGCADEGEVRDGVTIKSTGRTPSLWDGR